MSSQDLVAPQLPFEVTGQHMRDVTKQTFPALLRMLLHAEADRHGMPADGIHVSDNIDAPDGGEDGRIRWDGEPERTRFLPGRFCQFQLKTGNIGPSDAGNEVLTDKKEVKCMIRSALEQGGYYIFLSTHQYSQQLIERREHCIREALRGAGLAVDDVQVRFHDADWIAVWVNAYPAVATRLLEQVEPGLLGPFRSWDRWAARVEHSESRWVNDERIEGLRGFLLDQVAIAKPRKVARIIGLTAVGKSRLALEALCRFGRMVMYAVEGEASPETLMATVQKLADSGKRAIVVVDQCSPELHDRLSHMVSPATSQLSLVTINVDSDKALDDSTYKVRKASDAVTEAIVKNVAPDLSHLDQLRIVDFYSGFPGIAIRFAQTWNRSTPLGNAPDDELVEAYVLRHGTYGDPELLLQSAALLATFGDIGIEQETHLTNIAGLGRNLSPEDLRVGLIRLARKGVARRLGEGQYVLLDFSPIATGLSGRQWDEWDPDTWDAVLTDCSTSNTSAGSQSLCVQAANRLKLLNALDVSRDVVKHVCRRGGPIDDRLRETEDPLEMHTIGEVLLHLAEVDTGIVAELLKRSLTKDEALSSLAAWNLHLAPTLAKIAFKADTFEDGTRLLLRLAAAVNRPNVTRPFLDLFNPIGGSTEADGTRRLEFLASIPDADNTNQLEMVIEALAAGLQIGVATRSVGPEVHGTHRTLVSWYPETLEEASSYVHECAQRLIDLAIRSDPVGSHARKVLGPSLDPLIRYRFKGVTFIKIVERAVDQVGQAVDDWAEARDTLDRFLSDLGNDELEKQEQRVQEMSEEQAKEQALRKKWVKWAQGQLKQLEPK